MIDYVYTYSLGNGMSSDIAKAIERLWRNELARQQAMTVMGLDGQWALEPVDTTARAMAKRLGIVIDEEAGQERIDQETGKRTGDE